MTFMAEDLRREMAALGFRTVDEMVGHPERLRQKAGEGPWKARTLDLSAVLAVGTNLYGTSVPGASGTRFLEEMRFDMALERTLDATLFIPYTADAREHLTPIEFTADLANVNRCVGTMLGAAVTARHPEGLPDDTVRIRCQGSGGQSFGAFLPAGISLDISGDANDYVGKGLSGGIVSVHPGEGAAYKFNENTAIGNVAFYGATGGRGFVNGLAGQRFAVRNSGATVVAEGVGTCGCEYMTGGVALILGEVGPNFAAGMSGGVAYVYDELGTLESRVNKGLVDVLPCDGDDLERVRALIEEHVERTGSPLGIKLLYRFGPVSGRFRKVLPREYARVTALVDSAIAAGATRAEAEQQAFDAMRMGR